MIHEPSHNGEERGIRWDTGKSISDRGNGLCEGPEVRTSKVAGSSTQVRGRVREGEGSGVTRQIVQGFGDYGVDFSFYLE